MEAAVGFKSISDPPPGPEVDGREEKKKQQLPFEKENSISRTNTLPIGVNVRECVRNETQSSDHRRQFQKPRERIQRRGGTESD